jgi:hypothetical protein
MLTVGAPPAASPRQPCQQLSDAPACTCRDRRCLNAALIECRRARGCERRPAVARGPIVGKACTKRRALVRFGGADGIKGFRVAARSAHDREPHAKVDAFAQSLGKNLKFKKLSPRGQVWRRSDCLSQFAKRPRQCRSRSASMRP